ncbi:hypothetical protein PR003_g1003 [Phytophthora rubi]|uniref:Uncharacterized protein n=1 Tax=Phytophthora rubi TaxID=129364 RepID=A0A6A4G983_9STRA|nr:hypothetical protein PR001_g786 [Phytophthora rubi]KAE9358975.1 hypothetical protein PR003_g1003 [Phytophthora rubi]
MAALPPLSGHKSELRDPTLEELYTGPARALPDEIQQLAVEDTACTFCGVSYFVFAEVQTLQMTVKQYKKVFRDFVRFMERERFVARELRQQVTELKGNFAELVVTCSASATKLAEENEFQITAKQQALTQLERVQEELFASEEASKELQMLTKRSEEEQKMAHALVEQKLRNEILHLSSQVESCKLRSESQQASFKEDQERGQLRIRELESKLVESQSHWTAAERQMVTERDVLKQKLLAVNERVELESNTAQQLEVQLTAIREELARVVSASDTERKSNSQMSSEIIQIKHQLQALEKTRAQLYSENGRLKDEKYKLEDEIKALRLRADQLQGQLSISTTSTEKVKADYARDLEKLRSEHGVEINRLQRDHARAIEELQISQNTYLDYLKKETTELQMQGAQASHQAILTLEEKLRDAERRANEWKDRAVQNASEREEARRNSSHFESMAQMLQDKLKSSERDKQKTMDESKAASATLENKLMASQREADSVRQNANQQKALQDKNAALQQQIIDLHSELENLREQLTKPQPQVAWQTDPANDRKGSREERSNQDSHDNEKIISQLRHTLKQKDREIALLQQTVHRECMERTSLLERMRSGKVLPELPDVVSASFEKFERTSVMRSVTSSSSEDTGEGSERLGHGAIEDQQPKASFYEKLRRAGSRKPKTRK